MEQIMTLISLLIASALFNPCVFATALDDFHEVQFQCDSNKYEYFKAYPDYWSVISDYKTVEISKDPRIKDPHRRFRLHCNGRAVFYCGGTLEGPDNYEGSLKPDRHFNEGVIVVLYLDEKGNGFKLDTEGPNRNYDYFNYAIAGSENTTCISKLEEILVGKAKVDVDKICASKIGKKDYKERYAKTKADLERLMGYWKKEAAVKAKKK